MRLFLNGGGDAEKTLKTKFIFNDMIDHTKPLLYVPLAINLEYHSFEDCYRWVTEEFSMVNIPSIEMVKSFEELESKNFYDYCAIFIGGGNTYKLLKGLKESKAFDKIKEYINNDGIVYGSSAGAIIFGYDINSCMAMDENIVSLDDTLGFNVLNGKSIFAHYTNRSYYLDIIENEIRNQKYTNSLIMFSLKKGEVIAIPEEDTIFVSGNKISIIGNKPYYEFKNGKINKFDNKLIKDDIIILKK